MQKAFIVFGLFIATFMFAYAIIAGLVNQGHSLQAAGIIVLILAAGSALLIWAVRKQ
ncbi:MAG: hypothetical protein M3H12_14755 [Chromatiales bacterium]|uniref:hypothetical protein n=1 Tax=endosymbiont of Lamellibrachia barhami TaxID=205975 RepID=UPI0015AD99C3|nr:hypothetical protein [endosymbiont of Lamellibrachia barhami]MBA1444858.1 hypothetical protein [Gammaproteobacteria bacterium]